MFERFLNLKAAICLIDFEPKTLLINYEFWVIFTAPGRFRAKVGGTESFYGYIESYTVLIYCSKVSGST